MNRSSKLAVLTLVTLAAAARAEEPRHKPFVLASRGSGDLQATADQVKAKLAAAGFEVVGSYQPYPGAVVLAATSEALRAAVAQPSGGYAAAQRVTVTKVGDEVQVAYTNPVYMAHAYRLKNDLGAIATQLGQALGKLEEYGPPQGLTAAELHKYHYMLGMEYFDEPTRIGRFGSRQGANKAIEAGLKAGRGGARLVYKVDLPASDETLYGVALTEGCSGDEHIMKEIDAKGVRSTGHLPYEILVSGMNAYALYARFRIAVNFPDLKMMGDHSFMNIRCAPDAIEAALKAVTGQP
jgi:hypothetical protein